MSRGWIVVITDDAKDDFDKLSFRSQELVFKAITKVSANPLPQFRGGYGKPLGKELSGLFKIKLRDAGIRIVYGLVEVDGKMIVVVIGVRG